MVLIKKITIELLIFCFLSILSFQNAFALSQSIHLIEADKVQSMDFQGEGQTVCVIDSGINYTHPAR